MPRTDVYGGMLRRVFLETERPITVKDAAADVGCSIKRAYSWVTAHRTELVTYADRAEGGAAAYMAVNNPHRLGARSNGNERPGANEGARDSGHAGEAFGVGSTLHVVSMGLRNGGIELELMTAGGETMHVVIV
jgi:hypothetical protein